MRLWEHTPEELTTIPIPDLALLVLADFRDGSGWHKGNWMNAARQYQQQHFAHANVGNRLWEAWAWLDAHAFVSRRVDQDTPDSRRITEEGERALNWGLARLHAAARLEVELRDDSSWPATTRRRSSRRSALLRRRFALLLAQTTGTLVCA